MTPTPNPVLPAGVADVVDRLLARMRTSVCVIQRPVGTVDATGAPVSSFVTRAVVNCSVRSPSAIAFEGIGGGRLAPVVDYEVRFDRSVSVTSEDRILVNDRTLIVVADADAATSGFETRVLAKAVAS